MKKIYYASTYDEIVSTLVSIDKDEGAIIKIEKDIIFSKPIEISGFTGLEISSEKGHTLTGGTGNAKWKKSGDYLTCEVEKEPRILIINGRFVQKTSFPVSGYLENTDVSSYTWMNSQNGGWDKNPSTYDLTHITVKSADIPETFDATNCDIRAIHIWDESTVSVKNYDPDSGIIETANEMAHPAGAFDVHKYQFLNTKFGTPQKGRWFYERTEKKIYYCPADGENENNITGMIPVSQSIIIIKDCKNIHINNLKISLSNSEPGVISGLRAINPRGALQVEGSENITLDALEIEYSGGQGIKFLNSKNIGVTNCKIKNCASCGIATFECEDEHISYNVINDIGLADFSAVSVHAGGKSELVYVMDGCKKESGQTIIQSNIIDGSPYCGITCNGGPHIIKNNKVARCMQTLKDGGAIYCSRADGTLIKDNYISEVPSDTAYAIYLDELSESCTVDGNVSVDVNVPLSCHIAKNCAVSNNIAINNDETRIRLIRSKNFNFRNNIILSEKNITFDIKTYMPDEKYTLKDCATFSGDVFCAPDIEVDPRENSGLTVCEKLEFIRENNRFVFRQLPNDICNKYID